MTSGSEIMPMTAAGGGVPFGIGGTSGGGGSATSICCCVAPAGTSVSGGAFSRFGAAGAGAAVGRAAGPGRRGRASRMGRPGHEPGGVLALRRRLLGVSGGERGKQEHRHDGRRPRAQRGCTAGHANGRVTRTVGSRDGWGHAKLGGHGKAGMEHLEPRTKAKAEYLCLVIRLFDDEWRQVDVDQAEWRLPGDADSGADARCVR